MVRAALLLAGFWLGLLVASWVMASVNLKMAERVIGKEMRPDLAARLAGVSPEDRRVALRHLAAEINRWMFRRGSLAQLLLGLGLVALVWTRGGAPRALALVALGLTLVQAFGLAGQIASVGGGIEFLPRPLPADLARRFGALHSLRGRRPPEDGNPGRRRLRPRAAPVKRASPSHLGRWAFDATVRPGAPGRPTTSIRRCRGPWPTSSRSNRSG